MKKPLALMMICALLAPCALAEGAEEALDPVVFEVEAFELVDEDAAFIDAQTPASAPEARVVMAEATDIPIDEAHFPDAAFRGYVLENLDADNDGSLSDAEAGAVTDLSVPGLGIASLKGIECFHALNGLNGSENQLTSLDVSRCAQLKSLHCSENQLSSLSIRQCAALEEFSCQYNQLNSLDVKGHASLKMLACDNNQLTSLNVSGCAALETLGCSDNQLTSLNLSGCAALKKLWCDHNNLLSLDISQCPSLTNLHCNDNASSNKRLSSLDVSNCPALLAVIRTEPIYSLDGWLCYGDYNGYEPSLSCSMELDISPKAIPLSDGLYITRSGSNGTVKVNVGDLLLLIPSFATSSGWSVSDYKSSKPKVASVDGYEFLRANAEGETKLTVVTSKKNATVVIKVADPNKPTGVSINGDKTVTINLGETLQLSATLAPAGAKTTLKWKSSKKKVATVDDGLVTAQKEGKARITVVTANGKKATVTVRVVDPYKPTGVSITNGKAVTVNVGEALQLSATLAPASAKTTLKWKSSKKKVAKVDQSGLVTPLKAGKAKITVTTRNKKKAAVIVKVVDPTKPTGVNITGGVNTLKVGQTLQLGATLKPATAESGLKWKSSKKKIATVDKNGLVKAKKKGKVKITVTTVKGKKKASITIKVVP